MESMIKLFQCKWCLDQYSDPVLFPCSNTVCEKHTKELRDEDWKCRLCGGSHKLADGDKFLRNQIVVDMLGMNLSRLDFGTTYKAAKAEVDALESKKAELKHVVNAPGDHALTLCKKYRNQVDLSREEVLKIVDVVCESKNKLITEYKCQIVKKLGETTTSKRRLIESVDLKIKKWRQSLSELVVNEALWKEIVNEAQKLQKEIKSQLDSGFDPPEAVLNLSKSIDVSVWSELAKKAGIREYKLTEKSVLISEVSKIAKAESWDSIDSQPFTHNGSKFKIGVPFRRLVSELYLGAYLHLLSGPQKKVAWRFNVLGKHNQIIKHCDIEYELYDRGYGSSQLISFKELLAHPAYDPVEDAVRVEVVFKE